MLSKKVDVPQGFSRTDLKNNLIKANSNHIKSKSHYEFAKNSSNSPEKFNLKAIAAELQMAKNI